MPGYDDLAPDVKKSIKADYPEPKVKAVDKAPGKEKAPTIPNPKDPKNWMTQEEMDFLKIDPNDLSGKFLDHPGFQALPPRTYPQPQIPRDVTGPKTSKIDWPSILEPT